MLKKSKMNLAILGTFTALSSPIWASNVITNRDFLNQKDEYDAKRVAQHIEIALDEPNERIASFNQNRANDILNEQEDRNLAKSIHDNLNKQPEKENTLPRNLNKSTEKEKALEQIFEVLNSDPQLMETFKQRLAQSQRAPQEIENNGIIADGIKNAGFLSKRVCSVCNVLETGTNFLTPTLKWLGLIEVATVSEQLNTWSKGVKGASNVTSGITDSIIEQDPLHLFNSLGGVMQIGGALSQAKAQTYATELNSKKEELARYVEPFKEFQNSQCSGDVNFQKGTVKVDANIKILENNIKSLEKDISKFQKVTYAADLDSKAAENSVKKLKGRLNNQEMSAKEASQVFIECAYETVKEEMIHNPANSIGMLTEGANYLQGYVKTESNQTSSEVKKNGSES